MAMPSVSQRDWTVAKPHALPDDGNRYEIIDGVLYVTPSPRFLHQRALFDLAFLLRAYVQDVRMEIMCLTADIEYSDRTLVQPDLFVHPHIPGRRMREWADVHPLQLVAEVLSPSTKKRDRTVKRALYKAQRIPEYWIIDLDARVIERWLPDSMRPEFLTTTLTWQPVVSNAPLHIDLVTYFRAVLDD